MGNAEVKLFNAIYSGLYDYEAESKQAHLRVEELAEQFDEYVKDNTDDIRDAVKEFNSIRQDFISSDREAAAFMVMYEYCM